MLRYRSEFIRVPSCLSVLAYMIPALVQVMLMRVHPDTCTGSTLSLPWRGGGGGGGEDSRVKVAGMLMENF